ncbi:uncharacterized protein LOC106699327 isoform X2 [Myotis lucifugus]|uniref:uncharacterized protein LOC106699327 isoform X2 n=1 Tax=Myotis lucifugus TaxID=59463 RepID=UPI000CCC408E|nr:uncharacterized protein LOC106699327 isoform X2 [Myotis lucifugus]
MHFTEAAERKSEDQEPVGNGSHLIDKCLILRDQNRAESQGHNSQVPCPEDKRSVQGLICEQEAAPGSRSLWPEIHPMKPWAGTKIPIPVESPPERDRALLGAEDSVGCLERVTLLQAGPTFTASPQPSPQGKNTAKLVSAFRPVPVLSLEPTWLLPSWEIRKQRKEQDPLPASPAFWHMDGASRTLPLDPRCGRLPAGSFQEGRPGQGSLRSPGNGTSTLSCLSVSESVSEAPESGSRAARAHGATEGGGTAGFSLARAVRTHLTRTSILQSEWPAGLPHLDHSGR